MKEYDRFSLTARLAGFCADTRYEDIPAAVLHEARRLLLDTLGCALGGLNTPSGRIATQFAAMTGGNPDSTILGLAEKTAPSGAAYANARLANILDADDTFPTSSHFGNATVASALALGEWTDGSARDLLRAIAVGFEVGARIGGWIGWPVRFEDGAIVGWSPLAGPAATVTWASVGASNAVLGLDERWTEHAFGIAGANCPLPSMHKFGEQPQVAMHKYTDAGWCANVGVSAALLAKLNSTGFADVLDGPNGFWRFYGADGHDDAVLTEGLGERWSILDTSYKPWPCCRYIHHPLTALARLMNRVEISPSEIENVRVRVMPFALTAMFQEAQPNDMLSAQFSHAHAIAAFLHKVPAGPAWYRAETMESESIKALRARVKVEHHPTAMRQMAEAMQGPQWRQIPAEIEVETRDGVFREAATYALGDPWCAETRMSDQQLIAKFLAMASPDGETAQAPAAAHDLANRLLTLETGAIRIVGHEIGQLGQQVRTGRSGTAA